MLYVLEFTLFLMHIFSLNMLKGHFSIFKGRPMYIQLFRQLFPAQYLMDVTAHNWQKWKKSRFLTFSCHKIYREEADGQKFKFQLYFKNYDFCECVKFGANLWKIDILSITISLKFKSKNPFAQNYVSYIIMITCRTHHISILLYRFSVKYRFPFSVLYFLP